MIKILLPGNALVIILLACVGIVRPVQAQTVNWIGSVSTDYNTSANWDLTTFNPGSPAGTETVVIGAGNPYNPVQVGGNATRRVNRLNTLVGAHFTVRGTLYPNNSDRIDGNVNVEGNADFNIRSNVIIGNGATGTVTVTGGSFSSRGVMFVGRYAGGRGTLNIWGGRVNAGTDLQVGANGAQGAISFKSIGLLTVPGNKVAYLQGLLNSGVITVESGRVLNISYNAATNITEASIYQDPNGLLLEYPTYVVLNNGTVKATIQKATGEITSIIYKGKEMVSRQGAKTKIYYDWTSSYGFETMTNCTFSVTKRTDSLVDVSFKRVYAPSSGQFTPADIDIHYVLKTDDSGLYTYSVTEHQPSYPDVDLGSWRMVMWIAHDGSKNLCEKIYVDSIRHWEMPSPYDYANAQPTSIAEIVKLTTGVRAGKYDGKYEYSKELWELDAVGHASDVNSAGCWFVYGSHEFFNDGPTYADLNAAAGIIHATLNGLHYNSKGFVIPQGEYWRKIYGPFLLYFNDKPTGDEAWADAKARAATEKRQWPYTWLDNNPEYPLENERGSISGKFVINDPFKPTMTGANAWVGVTQISNDRGQWQFEAKNYHYWVKADANGNFTIPHVRPGTYSLFAFKTGEVGEYSIDNVTVNAGADADVGELVWNIPRTNGGLVWEIGVPDRTAAEFKYGDQAYMEGFLWEEFENLFPNPIEYNVADKNWDSVLNYVQSPYQDSTGGRQPWKWRINFNLPAGLPTSGNAVLTIAYASSDHSNQFIYVNNEARLFTNFYPPNSGGNALLRQANHAKYGVSTVNIPMSRLQAGLNTITLVMASTQSMANHIMYDYLSLEVPGIPTARMMADTTSGKAPLTVAFDALPSLVMPGEPASYVWDFGDGVTAEGIRVTHTFSAHGNYRATLTVTDRHGASDTTSLLINVLNNSPVAAFTATPSSGNAPVAVFFDATNSYDADSDSLFFEWNLGEGSTATGSSLTHIFPRGTYMVTLTVQDALGAKDTASTLVTSLNNAPVAHFTMTPASGFGPLEVSLDASASYDIDQDSLHFAWDFGDGQAGQGIQPVHQYLSPGRYTITLAIDDGHGGMDTTSAVVEVQSGLKVQYRVRGHCRPLSKQLSPDFRIVNGSDNPVPYSELTLRYWYTDEGNGRQLFWCDHAVVGTRYIKGEFVALDSPLDKANNYVEIRFTSSRSIPAGGNSGEINTRIQKSNGKWYDQRNDYSFDPSKRQFSDWSHVTLYRNGKLFWGTEPSPVATQPPPTWPGEGHRCRIYPNPSRANTLHIEGTIEERGFATVSIYNMLGVEMLKETIGVNNTGGWSHALETSVLPAGTYFVKVTLDQQQYAFIWIRQ